MGIDKKGRFFINGVAGDPLKFTADDNSMVEPNGGQNGQVIKKDANTSIWANESVKDVTVNGVSVVNSDGIAVVTDTGSSVVANPVLAGDEDALTGIQVDGTKFKVNAGGTEVIANPTLAGTESDLEGIQIGETKYKVPSGGGQQYDLVLTGENFNTNVVTLLTKIGEEIANYMGGIQPSNFEYIVKVENVSGQQLDYLFTQPSGVIQADYIVVLGINPSSTTTNEYTGYYFYCNLQGRNIPSAPSNLSLTTSAFDVEIEMHPGGSVEHPDPYATTNFTDNAFYNGTMTLGFASYLYRTVE